LITPAGRFRFQGKSFVVVEPEEHAEGEADGPVQPEVGGEPGVGHEEEANDDGFPELEFPAVGEGGEADDAEDDAGDETGGAEVEHGVWIADARGETSGDFGIGGGGNHGRREEGLFVI